MHAMKQHGEQSSWLEETANASAEMSFTMHMTIFANLISSVDAHTDELIIKDKLQRVFTAEFANIPKIFRERLCGTRTKVHDGASECARERTASTWLPSFGNQPATIGGGRRTATDERERESTLSSWSAWMFNLCTVSSTFD
jgi:hypothetical protein